MIMMDGKEAMTTFEHGNAVVFCDAFGGKLRVRFFYGDWITVTKTAESDQLDAAERKTLHDACISANMPAAMRTAALRWINDEHNNEHHEQSTAGTEQLPAPQRPSWADWLQGDWTEMLRSSV